MCSTIKISSNGLRIKRRINDTFSSHFYETAINNSNIIEIITDSFTSTIFKLNILFYFACNMSYISI